MKEAQKALFEGFSCGGSWVKLLGIGKMMKKIGFKKVKYEMEASYCLLSTYAWLKIFQRSGAKICIKQQMSFLRVLEDWAKSDSWVILSKSQRIALVDSKSDENIFQKPALCSLQ